MMEGIFIEFGIMVFHNDLICECVEMSSSLDKIENLKERDLRDIWVSLEKI